jgi:hypothetical protein
MGTRLQNVRATAELAHQPDILALVDGAQAAGAIPVDVTTSLPSQYKNGSVDLMELARSICAGRLLSGRRQCMSAGACCSLRQRNGGPSMTLLHVADWGQTDSRDRRTDCQLPLVGGGGDISVDRRTRCLLAYLYLERSEEVA